MRIEPTDNLKGIITLFCVVVCLIMFSFGRYAMVELANEAVALGAPDKLQVMCVDKIIFG